MKSTFKKAIVMAIVPAFVLAGCAKVEESQPAVLYAEEVAASNAVLQESYNEAKAGGYTGTIEEWSKLVQLHQTNPQEAAQQASDSGYSGMEMLMAGAMGMMLGNMMANNQSSRSYNSSTRAAQTSRSAQPAAKSASVSRGGFGGAVSSGG